MPPPPVRRRLCSCRSPVVIAVPPSSSTPSITQIAHTHTTGSTSTTTATTGAVVRGEPMIETVIVETIGAATGAVVIFVPLPSLLPSLGAGGGTTIRGRGAHM